jgi:DNA-binding GntR family transcriptional regulator
MLPWTTHSHADERLADIRETSLAKLVRDDMLASILNGNLVPGQRINEPDVASRLRVSRVPVREALRELESSGMVVSRKHAGVFVRQLTGKEIQDLYQLRGLLDGFAGRCAAQLPKEERTALAQVLEASIATMNAAVVAQQVAGYYAENLRFHWLIVEAVGNQQLSETYRGAVQKLHIARMKNLAKVSDMRASIAEHTTIVKALRNADAAQCETLLARHVSDAFDRLKKLFDAQNTRETTP